MPDRLAALDPGRFRLATAALLAGLAGRAWLDGEATPLLALGPVLIVLAVLWEEFRPSPVAAHGATLVEMVACVIAVHHAEFTVPAALVLPLPLTIAAARFGLARATLHWVGLCGAVLVAVVVDWNGASSAVVSPLVLLVVAWLAAAPVAALGSRLTEAARAGDEAGALGTRRAERAADLVEACAAVSEGDLDAEELLVRWGRRWLGGRLEVSATDAVPAAVRRDALAGDGRLVVGDLVPEDGRIPVALRLGAHRILHGDLEVWPDPLDAEALEVLALHVRSCRRAAEQAPVERHAPPAERASIAADPPRAHPDAEPALLDLDTVLPHLDRWYRELLEGLER